VARSNVALCHPPILDRWPLTGSVIVTLPQQVSLEDAARGLEMFRELNVPILGVVENMSYLELPDGTTMNIFGTGGGERLAEAAGVPFLGSIPMDPTVCQSGDVGKPVILSHPDSAVAQAMVSMSEKLAARISVQALKQENLIQIEFNKK